MITKDWHAAAGSWCFPIPQKPYRYVALENLALLHMRNDADKNNNFVDGSI